MHESFVKLFFNLSHLVRADLDNPTSKVQTVRVMYDREHGIPMMTPMVANSESLEALERERPGNYDVLVPRISSQPTVTLKGYFPPNQRIKPDFKSSLSLQQMRPFDSKTLFEGHRMKNIDKFDFEKITRIGDYVKEYGVVTFFMEDPKTAVTFLRSLGYLKKHYKHTCLLRHNHTGNLTPDRGLYCADDILVLHATIFDLPMAVPVYNFKKVDGLAIAIKTYWPKTSEKVGRLYFSDEIYITVAKHPENIILVDGGKINTPSFISSDMVTHMRNILERETVRRKDIPKLIEKAEKAKEADSKSLSDMISVSKRQKACQEYKYAGGGWDTSSSSTTIEFTSTTSYTTS